MMEIVNTLYLPLLFEIINYHHQLTFKRSSSFSRPHVAKPIGNCENFHKLAVMDFRSAFNVFSLSQMHSMISTPKVKNGSFPSVVSVRHLRTITSSTISCFFLHPDSLKLHHSRLLKFVEYIAIRF